MALLHAFSQTRVQNIGMSLRAIDRGSDTISAMNGGEALFPTPQCKRISRYTLQFGFKG